jgi:hypothetical protein
MKQEDSMLGLYYSNILLRIFKRSVTVFARPRLSSELKQNCYTLHRSIH